nr:type IV pilin protein [Variovorax sp. YR216]
MGRRAAGPGSLRGFTLIELMVTVAIVAILAAIAYPSYTRYIVRSNRAAAMGYMLEVTNRQQRYMLDARQYATWAQLNLTLPSNVSANYQIDTNPTGATPPGFTVTATPINSQLARDTQCGTLSIDDTGLKKALGNQTGVQGCW